MTDPYKVLGVSPNASSDEVKKAYRDLARKYHPDNYHDNPLADLASEKMKEINEAYDQITKSREQGGGSAYQYAPGGSAGGSRSYSNSGNTGNAGNTFFRVRQLINAGDLVQAEAILNGSAVRNAEWNYLMGSIYWRKGWMDEAGRYFRTAASMDPSNQEYRNAVQYMNQGGQAYRPAGAGSMSTNDICTICQTIYCMDCCCEMAGGDLIRCC